MTSSDLVRAYREGRLSRRELIRGLVAMGMSVSVATAIADRARAASSQSGGRATRSRAVEVVDDTYDDIYSPEAPVGVGGVVALPSTGVGRESTSAKLATPLAVIGAGAALAAAGIKRLKGSPKADPS